ncbi:TetR/AcrR family transcriptional regulator [Dyadobacter sp. 3J3]|uniref:TetR/AcrR family transcriptional regulator n=1 Tax=Dyadobacter sp. 3J3 TaxID=2606600 RepID=UPI001357B41C|nr:TetR/AcrR family transcriptional regulator [Dyadobacter sp. 3J3]
MLHHEVSIDTETLIKNAAKKVFLKKGLAGARLQEIADEAGIGRTALHYYFRSKEKLFSEVWKEFFAEVTKRIIQSHDTDMTITERMQFFATNYMDSAIENPEIDIFMLNEFNNNTGILKEIIKSATAMEDPANVLTSAIEKAVAAGEIVGDPKQIFVTLLSVCMFPFAGMAMFKSILELSDEAYLNLLRDRKVYVLNFLETAFKP